MLSDLKVRIIILSAAFILDLLFGDPKGMPHIVAGIGWLIKAVEDRLFVIFALGDGEEEDKGRKLIAGGILWFAVVSVSVAVPMFIVWLLWNTNRYLGIALECFICYQLLAVRSLFSESMRVYRALMTGDVEGARLAVSMIVGRDTDRLDTKGIARAAVETVAENTSDGIVAPLFYMALFGLPGMLFYKACNTLDSMAGYKNERYMYFGRFSARLDDVLNFIPARLAGFMMAVASGAAGFDRKQSLKIFFRDRKNHSSPNSAHCEAAMAGALGIQLGGDAWYFGHPHRKKTIGDPVREIEANDIKNANKLMLLTSVVAWLISLLCLLIAIRG